MLTAFIIAALITLAALLGAVSLALVLGDV